jgi:hypothetical protein
MASSSTGNDGIIILVARDPNIYWRMMSVAFVVFALLFGMAVAALDLDCFTD